MCLEYNKTSSDKLKLVLETTCLNFVKVYLVDSDGSLTSPFQKKKVSIGENGEVVSDRTSTEVADVEKVAHSIAMGIHVYAGHFSPTCNKREIILPVEVRAVDFVGCNYDQSHAVFSRIFINKDTLQSVIATEMERRKTSGEPLSNEAYYAQLEEDEDEEEEEWEEDEDDYDDDDDDECPYCGDVGCDGECEDEDDDEDWDDDDEDDWDDEDEDEDEDDEDE